jgi:hypothetical protein
MSNNLQMVGALLEEAGFWAAHALWCVSDGGPLVPFVGMEFQGGKRTLDRYVDEEHLERAVERARQALLVNADGALFATLIYDGYIALPDGKTDSLLLEARAYSVPPITVGMAVPYRNTEHPDGFTVFRPKFLAVSAPGEPDYAAMADSFFAGVDRHEKGAEVWNRCIDQSR